MERKVFLKRVGAAVMAAAMMAATAVPAFAASSSGSANNTATTNDLKDSDIIDMSRKGSLSIYKYDITSAVQDGAYEEGRYEANGEANSTLESELARYAIKGVEFTYLRVGDVETCSAAEDTENFVELVYEIPTDLADILGLKSGDAIDMSASAGVSNPCSNTGIGHYTSQQINDALKNLLESDNVKAKDALENYVTSDSKSAAMPLTDEKGHTAASDLELGLYLLVETKVPEEVVETVNPWFVQMPFTDIDGEEWLYDMTCYPKNQTGNPTLDKLVRNAHGDTASVAGVYEDYSRLVTNSGETDQDFVANRKEYTYDSTTTASEGDVLDYILVSKLPHITSEATYLTQYTFVDKLSEGLTYNKDVQIAFYTNGEDAAVNNTVNAETIWSLNDDGFAAEYVDVQSSTTKGTGETQLTVSFTEDGLKLLNTRYSDYYIVVYYTVTVNSDATAVLGDDGNPNDVTLTWERTSEGYYDTLEDRCYVYTFGLDLTKTFSDNAGDPAKVQFVLYNQEDAYYVVAESTGTTEDGKKVYYMTGKTTEKEQATVFSPDANGSMVVNGLEADTYQLTEIATDSGYSILKDQIVIRIQSAEREISPAVAGHVGLTATQADAADHTAGRTTGKVAMLVGDLSKSSATVDSVDADMSNYTIKTQKLTPCDSENAIVNIGITNSRSFLLPVTGGNGLYAITILGVIAVAAGCYFMVRKKKEA